MVFKLTIYQYPDCGILHNGFAIAKCHDCHHEYLFTYSCKRRNFYHSCHAGRVVIPPTAPPITGFSFQRASVTTSPKPSFVDFENSSLKVGGRKVGANYFPISIDYKKFVNFSKSSVTRKTLSRIKKATGNLKLIISVERLDYTKGISERLIAIERFFEKYAEYRGKLIFIQISVPSRTKIKEYIQFKNETDELVGRINGKFAEELWSPIIYIYKALSQPKLAAYYIAADICLVTPLRDGMNLIAKEYVTCKEGIDGALILSEFAGCADEFKKYSIMVNPYDTESVAYSIYYALKMNKEEKQQKMLALRNIVRENDVYRWCNDFLNRFQQIKEGYD
ncbi:MAG: hypothetical protein FJW61_00100 [Actinobacteria bacterium]|nr:hypothetical protein [Actinomycetota bacterium]